MPNGANNELGALYIYKLTTDLARIMKEIIFYPFPDYKMGIEGGDIRTGGAE